MKIGLLTIATALLSAQYVAGAGAKGTLSLSSGTSSSGSSGTLSVSSGTSSSGSNFLDCSWLSFLPDRVRNT